MRLNFKSYFISSISLLFLLLIFFYIYSGLKEKNSALIEFSNTDLSSKFEMDIYNNINNINTYLNNFNFINSYLVKKLKKKITIKIVLKKPFAKNNLNKEVIFNDSSKASFKFFNQSYIKSIKLVDTTIESLEINYYLQSNFEELNKIFNINQIEFIDERRYNLTLDNNIKVMLPKKIDRKLISFINKNFDLLKNNADFEEYLDFRNFNEKTIRVK